MSSVKQQISSRINEYGYLKEEVRMMMTMKDDEDDEDSYFAGCSYPVTARGVAQSALWSRGRHSGPACRSAASALSLAATAARAWSTDDLAATAA